MEKIEYTVTDPHAGDCACRGTLADLILDAQIIPRCGLIPPFRVMVSLLKSGKAGGGMSPGCIWHPFELSEDDYWDAIDQLESFASDDLKTRHLDPCIVGEIQLDYDAPETDNYLVWLESLKVRKLLN